MDNITYDTIRALYLFVPAFLANMAPVLAAYFGMLECLNVPIDLNSKWRTMPLFGPHKTFRGFAVGIFFGILTAYTQFFLYQYPLFRDISYLDYTLYSPFVIGFLAGFGALFGDLIKSFFKRRFHIASGKPFFPFDQWDLVIGAYIFLSFYIVFPFSYLIILLIITPILHLASNFVGYKLGLKDVWW